MDRQQTARDLFLARRTELQEDMRSMSDEFDKAILTLSSGGLGLSLAFLKGIISLNEAHHLTLLYVSWATFVIAIITTVFSFPLSILSLECALRDAEQYYLHDKDECFNRKTWHISTLKWSRWIAGSSFVAAVIFTSLFVGVNFQVRSTALSDSSNPTRTTDGRVPLSTVEKPDFTKGRVASPMVPMPDVNTGRIAPAMVPKPSAPSPTKQPENKK